MSIIVAFCGSKGAGKDTSASIFKDMVEKEVEELALAGPLKENCSKAFGVDMVNFTDQSLKEKELEEFIVLDMDNLSELMESFNVDSKDEKIKTLIKKHVGTILHTPRKLLQYIGTELLREVDPLVHAKLLVSKKSKSKISLVTDLRFQNEFDYLRDNAENFIPVYVRNPRAEAAAAVDMHPSERDLDNFKNKCYKLDNEGTLVDLKANIESLIQTHLKG